jgi:hypothetical protein
MICDSLGIHFLGAWPSASVLSQSWMGCPGQHGSNALYLSLKIEHTYIHCILT